MNEYRDFTSLPPEQEAQFIVYEQRSQFWSKKAMNIGIISAAIFGVLMVIIVFSHDAPKNKMADDDIGMLGDDKDIEHQRSKLKETTREAPAPAPAPTPAPTPAPAPEAESSGGAAAPPPGAESPASGGATKAPPTP